MMFPGAIAITHTNQDVVKSILVDSEKLSTIDNTQSVEFLKLPVTTSGSVKLAINKGLNPKDHKTFLINKDFIQLDLQARFLDKDDVPAASSAAGITDGWIDGRDGDIPFELLSFEGRPFWENVETLELKFNYDKAVGLCEDNSPTVNPAKPSLVCEIPEPENEKITEGDGLEMSHILLIIFIVLIVVIAIGVGIYQAVKKYKRTAETVGNIVDKTTLII